MPGKNYTILAVDDEEIVRYVLSKKLNEADYRCLVAKDAEEALSILRKNLVDLALLDIMMPGKSGFDLLSDINKEGIDTACMMLTAVNDTSVAVEAMKLGAYDYVLKPFNLEEVLIKIKKVLEKKKLEKMVEDYTKHLEDMVKEKTSEIELKNKELKSSFYDSIKLFINLLQKINPEQGSHSIRVTQISLSIGLRMNLDEESLLNLEAASLLHNVGLIGLDTIKERKETLHPEELYYITYHSLFGEEILKNIKSLMKVSKIVGALNERVDGKGPKKLLKFEIPLESRILAVANRYDTFDTNREGYGLKSKEEILQLIKDKSGEIFDPEVVDCFLSIIDIIDEPPPEAKEVKIENIKEGYILAEELWTKNNVCFLHANTQLTKPYIDAINFLKTESLIDDNLKIFEK